MNFVTAGQPVVDAAFLGRTLYFARANFGKLDARVQDNAGGIIVANAATNPPGEIGCYSVPAIEANMWAGPLPERALSAGGEQA